MHKRAGHNKKLPARLAPSFGHLHVAFVLHSVVGKSGRPDLNPSRKRWFSAARFSTEQSSFEMSILFNGTNRCDAVSHSEHRTIAATEARRNPRFFETSNKTVGPLR